MTSPQTENEWEMSDSWVKIKLYTVFCTSHEITYRSMSIFSSLLIKFQLIYYVDFVTFMSTMSLLKNNGESPEESNMDDQ